MTYPLPSRPRRPRLRSTVAILAAASSLAAAAPPAPAAPPPAAPHVVTIQSGTDGVVLTDYATSSPVTVQVLRGGVVIATSQAATPAADVGATLVTLNSAAGTGVCWLDHTPDIVPGDVIRVIQGTTIEDSTALDITVEPPVDSPPNKVEFHGIARNAGAIRLPPGISPDMRLSNPAFRGTPNSIGPSLRVPGALGSIGYDLATGTTWTATFAPLDMAQHAAALSSATDATVAWTSALGSEVTEVTLGTFGGPQTPCTAPLLTEGITSLTPPAFVFDSDSLMIAGVAASDVTAVGIAISDANPFTPDVNAPVTPQTAGGGKIWTVTLPASSILPLTDGSLTITPTFNGPPVPRMGTPRTITKNMVVPDLTAPVASIVAGPNPFTRSSVATFDLASTEPGTFQCRLDAAPFALCADPTLLTGLVRGPHTFTVRSIDGAGNVSAEVTRFWQVDQKGPRVTATISVARRGALARTGVVIAATTCDERCTVTVEAKLLIPGAIPVRARVITRTLTINPAITGLARARLSNSRLGAIRQSLRSGRTVRVFLNVTAVDRAGNRTVIHANIPVTKADLR